MNKRQKDEALRLYFSEGLEMNETAERLGVTLSEVYRTLSDPLLLRPYMQQSEAAKIRAQICVNEKAEEAARKQAELITLGKAAGEQSVSQRAAKDILDRAGISTKAQEDKAVHIVLDGMPQLGMPRRREEDA